MGCFNGDIKTLKNFKITLIMETKKILFILLMLVSSIGIISAQDKWSIGPRGGVNFSNVTNVDDSKSLTGGVIGLSTTYSINENSGITLDALYSVEGWEDRFQENRLHYLQIPLYYDFFFGTRYSISSKSICGRSTWILSG